MEVVNANEALDWLDKDLDSTEPPPEKIRRLMAELDPWLNEADDHPVVVAARAHISLVQNHSLSDCRILASYILTRCGFPPALYTSENRDRYIKALDDAKRGNEEPFILVTAEAVEWTLDRYLMIVDAL